MKIEIEVKEKTSDKVTYILGSTTLEFDIKDFDFLYNEGGVDKVILKKIYLMIKKRIKENKICMKQL